MTRRSNRELDKFTKDELIFALLNRDGFVGIVVWREGDSYSYDVPAEQPKAITLAVLTEAFDVAEKME